MYIKRFQYNFGRFTQIHLKMNLRLFHFIGVLFILFAAANCVPFFKSTNDSTTVKQKEDTCSMITTQEECLKSPCIWCETECVSYNTSNLILGKPNNCSSTNLTSELLSPKKITKKLLWIIFSLAFIGLLILCCCCCFCFGCLLW